MPLRGFQQKGGPQEDKNRKKEETEWKEGTSQNKSVGGRSDKKIRFRKPNQIKWRDRLPSTLTVVCLTILRFGREQGGGVWQTHSATLGEGSGKKQVWVK